MHGDDELKSPLRNNLNVLVEPDFADTDVGLVVSTGLEKSLSTRR